jgi:hypothetical protein
MINNNSLMTISAPQILEHSSLDHHFGLNWSRYTFTNCNLYYALFCDV